MPRRLGSSFGVEVWSDLCITEQVPEPGACREVVDGLGRACFPVWQRQPPVSTTGRTAAAVGVLVVGELGVLAVDERDMVVGAGLDFAYSAFTDFFEERF